MKVIEDICNLISQVSGGNSYHVPRDGNQVAHQLAFFALCSSIEFLGVDKTPLFLSKFVIAGSDHVNNINRTFPKNKIK